MYSIIFGSTTNGQTALRLLALLVAVTGCYLYSLSPIFSGNNKAEAVIYYAMCPVALAIGYGLKLKSPHDLVATGLAAVFNLAGVTLMVVDWHFLGSVCSLLGIIELISKSVPTIWAKGDMRP